jgi:hypothetical protein
MQGVPYRGGAEEARGTHNPEDVGSIPTSGILHSFACFTQTGRHMLSDEKHSKLVSGVAQTVSARRGMR